MNPFESHPLTRESDAQGMWGWIDRTSDRVAGWLNPILIKEARQALKSKQFIITFFTLLTCTWGWTVLGIMLNAPAVYYLPSGMEMLYGYYFVLAIPMLGMVPLVAHRSLAAEIDDGTFEMLAITKLSSLRIVLGKLNSAILQMMIYFAAVVPGLAFAYLLRGVNLPTMLMMVLIIFFTALILTTLGLLLSTMASHRAWQALFMLGLVGVIVIAQFIVGAVCLEGILGEDAGSEPFAWLMVLAFGLVGSGCMVVLVKAAAARIAPVTENRSTGIRWSLMGLQATWVFVIILVTLYVSSDSASGMVDSEPINFGMMVLAGYWLCMGTLMLAESPEMSPRVQRDLPQTFMGRAMLLWLSPGPGTGYMFTLCTAWSGIAVLALFAFLPPFSTQSTFRAATDPPVMAIMTIGHLMLFLSFLRLWVMVTSVWFGRSFILPIISLGFLLFAGTIAPSILMIITTGAISNDYWILETSNIFWTYEEAFSGGIAMEQALLVFLLGLIGVAVNLLLFFREFDYRRTLTPARIKELSTKKTSPVSAVEPE